MLPQLIGLLVSVVMVATAGLDGFGIYSLALVLVSATFGCMGGALDVDFQRGNTADFLASVAASKVIGWCCWLPVVLGLAWFLDLGAMLVGFVMLGVLCQQLIESFCAARRIEGLDARAVLPRLIPATAVLVLLVVLRPEPPISLALCFLTGWALFGVVLFFRTATRFTLQMPDSIKRLRSMMPIWGSLILTQVYGNLDLYLIKAELSEAAVGTYKLAYTFAGVVVPVAGVLSVIYLSKISTAAAMRDLSIFRETFFRQLMIAGSLGVLFVLFMISLFPFLLGNFYGGKADNAINPAVILSIAMLMNVIMMVFSYTLLALGMDRMILIMTALTAGLYIPLAYLLVKYFGLNGAPLAMCISYGFSIIGYIAIFSWKRVLHRFPCPREG